MELKEKLSKIQTELKVNKAQWNKFGKYNYRSAEDILEAIKPMQKEYSVVFKTSDEIKEVAGRAYVETTAKIIDIGTTSQIEAKAQAMIDFNAKGMQDPQRTGAASSYAKKYAYGNLLLIDDTKDSDATNKGDDKPALEGDRLSKAIKAVAEGKIQLSSLVSKFEISAKDLRKFNNNNNN